MNILLILLLFNLAFNAEKISNFDEITYPEGVSEYSYQYLNMTLEEKRDSYFFFNFTNKQDIKLKIIDSDGNETNLENDYSVWLEFNISSKISQKYIFQITNNGKEPGKMIFIDNTQEINTNLDRFINLNFSTTYINSRAPLPLIFNIDTINEDMYYDFEESNNNRYVYGGDYVLNFCELHNISTCEFKGYRAFHFEKGKKYKAKLEWYTDKYESQFYLSKISFILYYINDIELGTTIYETNGKRRKRFFLLNAMDFKNLYIYVKKSYSRVTTSSCTEKEKQLFPYKIEYTGYNYGEEGKFFSNTIYDNDDYLILKIEDGEEIYTNFIHIVNYNNQIVGKALTFEYDKGTYGIISKSTYFYDNFYIISNNKNMVFFDKGYPLKNFSYIIFIQDLPYDSYVYVNSTKEKTIIKGNIYKKVENFNLILNKDLVYFMDKYGPDSMFIRTNFHSVDFITNSSYLFGIEEKYYLYVKKYYGSTDIYKYNKELNTLSNFTQFQEPISSYDNSYDYNSINNKLITFTGCNFFTFHMNYNSLFDFLIQKVEDLPIVEINSNMFKFNNLVKLFNPNKKYYLNFTIDHLIKLDNNFLDAEVIFTDDNGKVFILNKSNRIIKDLGGNNISLISDKQVLIYFYKKIPNYSDSNVIVFDSKQKSKNIKFKITNNNNESNLKLLLAKDFGFEGYYPMLNQKNWEELNINNNDTTIYVDNYYDKIEYDLYEDEKYIIYIFETFDESNIPILNSKNFKISDITYINNLLTPGNKYNFEVIPPNNEGSLILSTKNKPKIKYQFITCKSKEIKFKVENSNNLFKSGNYPYQQTINENKIISLNLNDNEILSHTFSSNNEFLFIYFILNKYEQYDYGRLNIDYSIESFELISDNLFRLEFTHAYFDSNDKYYIIISKKDELNNKETFSNPCYLANLLIKNSDSIFVKSIYSKTKNRIDMPEYINITKINIKEGDEIVINIIYQKISIKYVQLKFYTPKEFKIFQKKIKYVNPEEQISFNEKDNIFKFEYKQEDSSDQLVLFNVDSREQANIFLVGHDKIQEMKADHFNRDIYFSIRESGIYYIEFHQQYPYRKPVGTFSFYITGRVQTIDLTQKFYSKNLNFKVGVKTNPDLIKVINLKEDRYVFFDYNADSFNSKKNPFVICKDNNDDKCTQNIKIFHFLKENNYTIKINAIPEDSSYPENYYYTSYSFFPIFESTFKYIDQGYHAFSGLQIYAIKTGNKTEINLLCENIGKIYFTTSEEEFTIDNIKDYNFGTIFTDLITIEPQRNRIKHALYILIQTSENKNLSKFIYADKVISPSKSGEFLIESGITSIIYFSKDLHSKLNYLKNNYNLNKEDDEFPDYKNPLINYNTLSIISSPVKNMKLIIPSSIKEESDLIVQNYFGYSVYVEKYDKDINITIKKYEPRFSFFGAGNEELFNLYINEISQLTGLISQSDLINMNSVLLRIDSNQIPIYEFFNFYTYNFESKINIYFKNYYGSSDVYLKHMDLLSSKDFSILTKPFKSYEYKNSVSNKLFNFENNTIISLNLFPDSFFDLYIEIESNKTIINPFPISSLDIFKNGGKLLQKNIEYTINLTVNHLFKLEPGFDAVVNIYDEKNNIITLNKSHPVGKFIGNNVKIKSNNIAFIYFFGKRLPTFKQLKFDPKETGKNAEIFLKANSIFIIDIGFDNYNPTDILSYGNYFMKNDGYIYIENIYDKLKINLVKDEYFYFYYYSGEMMNVTINYTENLRHKNNEYNFYIIPKNSLEKSLILKKGQKENITYQVYFCQSPHTINLFHHDAESSEPIKLEFNENKTVIDKVVKSGPSIKLTFDSEEDFIFSYSFSDTTDPKIKECEKWNKERIVLTDLAIQNVNKKYKDDKFSNILTVKFKPNYMKSSTRYIIVIAPMDSNNSMENLSNPCYVTKLITEKTEGVLIKNYYDIGENDSIEIDVDISDIIDDIGNYIITIMSQELRFEKKLNYYRPFKFSHEIVKPVEIKLDEEEKFNIGNDKLYFSLLYTKKSEINEIFFLYYKLEEQANIVIEIIGPKNYNRLFNINKTDGYISFIFNEGGKYKIFFTSNKTNVNTEYRGSFKIISSEYPSKINITSNKINFDEINSNENQPNSLKFYTDILDHDYIKKIEISNINQSDINKIVLIKKDDGEYKALNFSYFTFETNSKYNIIINFNKKDDYEYTLEKFNIKEFSLDNIQNFSQGNKKYNNTEDKFLIINWENYDNIKINILNNNNTVFYIAKINENQSKDLYKEFQNMNFEKLENLNIEKPNDSKYGVLMIELKENETEIFFETKSSGKKSDDELPIPLVYIICIGVFALLLLIVVLIFIIKCCSKKKNKEIDFERQPNETEALMSDL